MLNRLYACVIVCSFLTVSNISLASDENKTSYLKEFDTTIKPFKEIGESLGSRALGNNMSPVMRGVVVFDANGDGLNDIYLPNSGRPIAKKTDEKAMLLIDETVPAKPNTLFLNMGNDKKGEPIYKSVQELVKKNNKNIQKELLIENKYKPRQSLKDDEFSIGRNAYGAIASDFNGDGRLDLYVLNNHYGVVYNNEEIAFTVYPAKNNLGREDRDTREQFKVMNPPFIETDNTDGLNNRVTFGDKEEWEGKNILYLNMGDSDNDGIPEWKDVTDEAGIGGKWASLSATVADVDRDGDLDIYVANLLDYDFFNTSTQKFAGNRNQLYINQLSQTGKLEFIDKALDMGVSGLHAAENLNDEIYVPGTNSFVKVSDQKSNGKQVGELADHSWIALLADWNSDGYPDLIVGNDVGNGLRVYENDKGNKFKLVDYFNNHSWDGSWMALSVNDLDGDLNPDMLLMNIGSQVMTKNNNAAIIEHDNSADAGLAALTAINYPLGKGVNHNSLVTYKDGQYIDKTFDAFIYHSPYIAPEVTHKPNFIDRHGDFYEKMKFRNSFTGLEFSWGVAMLDVENDGDLDIYTVGGFARGNSFFGASARNPGRLLRNHSRKGTYAFEDRTIEYRLLDITDIDYDHDPIRRPAPSTGWDKRDYIHLDDVSSYQENGVDSTKGTKVPDIFRVTEAGVGVISTDLNNDGFDDILVTHIAGYDSVSPKTAKNMKFMHEGKLLAVPAQNRLVTAPTNFEESKTFLYINGEGASSKNNWIKITLIDESSKNLYSVGAKVVINDKAVRYNSVGGESLSSARHTPISFGLGSDSVNEIEIVWPSGSNKKDVYKLTTPVKNSHICIDRKTGINDCSSRALGFVKVH